MLTVQLYASPHWEECRVGEVLAGFAKATLCRRSSKVREF